MLGAKPAFTFFPSGEGTGSALSYAELDRQARPVALALRATCAPH